MTKIVVATSLTGSSPLVITIGMEAVAALAASAADHRERIDLKATMTKIVVATSLTGSSPLVITIGMEAVAALAASAAGGENAAITFTLRSTKSVANAGTRS